MYYKSEKGVTIVALVITVVVLLILVTASINFGLNGISSVEDSKLTAEVEMVGHAILEQYTKYKTTKDTSYLVGTKITDEEAKKYASELGVELVNIPSSYTNKEYRLLNKEALETIGIQDSDYEYIINYISGEVMNVTKKKTSSNNPLYTKSISVFNIED